VAGGCLLHARSPSRRDFCRDGWLYCAGAAEGRGIKP
jgi:hypothetical protein